MPVVKSTMHRIQEALQALDLYADKIDGVKGFLTKSAIIKFQRLHGLTVAGIAGPETMDELFPFPIAGRSNGLDPFKTFRWPHQDRVSVFYGPRGKNLTRVEVPWDMYLAWDKSHRVSTITVNERCALSAQTCLDRIAETYSFREITDCGFDMFGGSLNVRKMRGGDKWSMHSWAIAIDFDPARNRLRWGRSKARLAMPDCEEFWRIWESEEWTSLGRVKNYDFMHIQAARI